MVYGLDKTFTINATTNKDATGEDIVWSCDDNRFGVDGNEGPSIYVSVPTLDEFDPDNGYEEEIYISFTAKSAEGGVSDSIDITIRKQRLTSLITLKEKSTEMVVGAYYQINATVKNDDADVKTLTYKSNNTKVATVKNTGEVYAVGEGTTEIIISATDGGASDVKFTVTVKTNSESSLSPTIVGTFSAISDYQYHIGKLEINSDGTAALKICDIDDETQIVEQYTLSFDKIDKNGYYHFTCNETNGFEMLVDDYKEKEKISVRFADDSDETYMFCDYYCGFGADGMGWLDFDREA